MSSSNPFRQSSPEPDDLPPPPYTANPTDDVSLEFGPSRPFRPPPQQPPPLAPAISDFARDFYSAGGARRGSQSTGDLHHPHAQNSFPDDGRPTRTPVPGHPLLNNGKTLVYTMGYECYKCHNTGYKSYDPSNPCRKCWEKYSKPYSGPIVYASWNDGSSNRQRPLLHLRSPTTGHSLSRSISSFVSQARNDISSLPGSSARRPYPPPPPSTPARPPPHPPHRPPLPPRHQQGYLPMQINRAPSTSWTRTAPPAPLVLRPGDPRIGGSQCWNCFGSGRTLGFLLLSDRNCDVCNGIGRLL